MLSDLIRRRVKGYFLNSIFHLIFFVGLTLESFETFRSLTADDIAKEVYLVPFLYLRGISNNQDRHGDLSNRYQLYLKVFEYFHLQMKEYGFHLLYKLVVGNVIPI